MGVSGWEMTLHGSSPNACCEIVSIAQAERRDGRLQGPVVQPVLGQLMLMAQGQMGVCKAKSLLQLEG